MIDASRSPITAETRVGTVLADRLALTSVLGVGAIGTVYLAEKLPERARVAVKLLRAEYAGMPEVVARFEREARAMQAIAHPNVVRALEFGRTAGGEAFLVMELAEGDSLRALLARAGALPVGAAVEVGRQICAALDAAHARRIVHRDLKPENVIVADLSGRTPRVKVLDFGMARVTSGVFSRGTPLTAQGTVFGTPEYMAPEQAMGQPVDAPADQYALGVMLYEMLAGARPFRGDTALDTVQQQISAPPPPLAAAAPWVPPAIAAVVERMLAKKPDDRFPGVAAAAQALDAAERSPHAPAEAVAAGAEDNRASPVRVVVAVGIAVVLLAIAAGVATLGKPTPTTPPASPSALPR